ncbi:hypothetical protein L195_g028166, partial [Trifolium pratense]
ARPFVIKSLSLRPSIRLAKGYGDVFFMSSFGAPCFWLYGHSPNGGVFAKQGDVFFTSNVGAPCF